MIMTIAIFYVYAGEFLSPLVLRVFNFFDIPTEACGDRTGFHLNESDSMNGNFVGGRRLLNETRLLMPSI